MASRHRTQTANPQKILARAPLRARLSLDEKLELTRFEKQYVKAYAIR